MTDNKDLNQRFDKLKARLESLALAPRPLRPDSRIKVVLLSIPSIRMAFLFLSSFTVILFYGL